MRTTIARLTVSERMACVPQTGEQSYAVDQILNDVGARHGRSRIGRLLQWQIPCTRISNLSAKDERGVANNADYRFDALDADLRCVGSNRHCCCLLAAKHNKITVFDIGKHHQTESQAYG
jgi:hypothetical protein